MEVTKPREAFIKLKTLIMLLMVMMFSLKLMHRNDISRNCLLQQESFQRLLHKQDGVRSEWEYPFAVAGINISFMLVQMLDLQSGMNASLLPKANSRLCYLCLQIMG